MMPLVFLLACADTSFVAAPRDSGTEAPALTIASLSPSRGPVAGGTPVVVRGTGFTEGSVASVGGSACASLAYTTPQELTCVTPPGEAGDSALVVIEGASTAEARFTYTSDGASDSGQDTGGGDTADSAGDTADSGDSGPTDTSGGDTGSTDTGAGDTGDTAAAGPLVDYCHLQWPCTMSKAPGVPSDAVYAWVYQSDRTRGAGAGAGLRVEVGVGPSGSHPLHDVGWTWTTASYNADKDGLTPGDLANDEYVGNFVVPSRGAWDYCMRVSLDEGRTWQACDGGGASCVGRGTDDGYRPDDAGQLTVR
jgi:hypothetical protein